MTFTKLYLIYSLFIILILEYFSMLINSWPEYDLFWYPMLQNLGYINLLLTLYFHSEELMFCKFKKQSFLLLIFYFIFNVIALILQFNYYYYIKISQYILLIGTTTLFIYSLYFNRYVKRNMQSKHD